MKHSDPFVEKTRELISQHPVGNIFPPEPWSMGDLHEIAQIIQDHVMTSDDVISDQNKYVDWLDRWFFYRSK